jgi:hypothetical protein
MGKSTFGLLVAFAAAISAQPSNQITIVPNSKGERGFIAFRENLSSNGRDSVRLEGPNAIGKDLAIGLPSIKGEILESLAIISEPEETTTLDRVRIGFREMVTAFDDGRSQTIHREKKFLTPLRVQIGTYVHDDGDFSGSPLSLYGAGLMSHRLDPMSNADDVELDANSLRFNDPFTGGNLMQVGKDIIRMNTPGALWQIEGGLEIMQEKADTPAVPPVGYVLRYAKAGVGCTLDSAGSEVCGGGSGAVNPIPYIYSTTSQLRLQQQGGSIGSTQILIGGDIGNFGAAIDCSVVDACELNLGGSLSDMTVRMEGRSAFKLMPAAFSSGPEFQIGRQSSYPNEFGMSINGAAAAMLQGKPFVWEAPDGSFVGMRARNGSRNEVWEWPTDAAIAGDCLKVLSPVDRTYEHGPCGTSSGGPFVDLSTNQTIGGIKFFSNQVKAQNINIAASAGGATVSAHFVAGSGAGASEWWSGSSGARTVFIEGLYSGTNVGALSFLDPSGGGAETVRLQGGSSTAAPSLTFVRGSTALTAGAGGTGGYVNVFTASGTQVISIDGQGGGRIRVDDGSTLRTGYTGARTFGACSINWAMGIVISVTGPLTCI